MTTLLTRKRRDISISHNKEHDLWVVCWNDQNLSSGGQAVHKSVVAACLKALCLYMR
ncbi:TPA: hypothetical protein ACIKT7_000643 [Serratia marcescens]